MFGTTWRTLKDTAGDFFESKPFQLAAALSYYTLLSMAPLLLLVTGLAGLVLGEAAARARLLQYVDSMMGSQEAEVVRALMTQAGNHHAGVVSTIIGLVVLVIGATTVFGQLQTALNQIWGVQAVPARNMVVQMLVARVRALVIVFGMALVLLVSMLASVALAGAQQHFAHLFPGAGVALRVVEALVAFLLLTGLVALLFKHVPDAKIEWHEVIIGALITAVLLTAGKFGLGAYLARLRYSSAGAAGSLILIVVWVYYSALILFLGAEVTKVVACRFGKPIKPKAHAMRVKDSDDAPSTPGTP